MKSQFARFLIAGGANTVATYAIYFALLYFVNPYWSYAVSFVSGIFISYFLNLKFTFRTEHSTGKVFLYSLAYPVQFLLGISTLHFSLKAGVPEEFAALFAAVVAVPVKFFMSRWALVGNGGQNPLTLLSISAFAVSIAAAYGTLVSDELFPRGILFSSDFSTLYLMWKDIFLEGGSLSEWNFSRVTAPYILTDIPVIWAIYSIIGGYFAAGIHLFGIVMFVLFATGWMLVSDFLFGGSAVRRSLVFILSALVCVLLSRGAADLFGIVFFPAAHFSTFVFIPFCLLIFLRAASAGKFPESVVYSVLLAAVCSALTYSDPIFTVWFVAPAFAAGGLCLFLRERKNLLPPLAALPAGFVCSRFFGKFFIESGATTVNSSGLGEPEYIAIALRDFLMWTSEAAARHPLLAVLWVLFFIFLFRTVFFAFFRNGMPAPKVLFVLVFFIFSSAASAFAAVLTGNFEMSSLPESPANVSRFLLPFYFIPLSVGWAFIRDFRQVFPKRFLPFSTQTFATAASVFLLAVSLSGALKLKENSSAFVQYYPPVAECFDANARRFNLKRGLASYWWAKSIMAASKTDVSIAHVSVYPTADGGVGLYKFFFGISDRFYEGPFDFVITNKTRMIPEQDPCMGDKSSRCGHLLSSKRDPTSTYILRPEHVDYVFKRKPSAAFSCGGAQVLVFSPPLN